MVVNILGIVDDAKCYEVVRSLRWPDGVRCPHCDSAHVVKQGRDETQPERRRYGCRDCGRRFDDLTDTIFAGHHQPLRIWVLVLFLMGLNLSNEQIAQELDLDPDDAQKMATLLRAGIVQRKPEGTLSGELECDEVYVVAGHKGHPEAVRKKGEKDDGGG
jgi:transposase-like protein